MLTSVSTLTTAHLKPSGSFRLLDPTRMDRLRWTASLQVCLGGGCAPSVHPHASSRVVPRERYLTSVCKHGVGIAQCCMAMQSWGDVCAADSGLTVAAEVRGNGPSKRSLLTVCHTPPQMRIVPDHSTLTVLPWRPSHGMALVNMCTTPGMAMHHNPCKCSMMCDILVGMIMYHVKHAPSC